MAKSIGLIDAIMVSASTLTSLKTTIDGPTATVNANALMVATRKTQPTVPNRPNSQCIDTDKFENNYRWAYNNRTHLI